jgi:zinc protease
MAALFETSTSVVNTMGTLFTYRLPNNYFQTYPTQIKAVTPEKVQALAGKLLKPDSMTIVAVGDRAKIEPELKALNLGNVEVRDADAKPVLGGVTSSGSGTQRK